MAQPPKKLSQEEIKKRLEELNAKKKPPARMLPIVLNKTIVETGTGVSDHGALTGLSDDDHTQYHNDTRGDARYYTQIQLNAGQLDTRYYTEAEIDALLLGYSLVGHAHDHGTLTGLSDDDHTQYHNDARGDARYSLLGHTHAAGDIVSGQLALARGGTNADLSATGGASQVLKQASAGAAITVGQLAPLDLSGWPANAAGALTNDGAGNLSWVAGGGGYTDEQAQDAVGTILTDSATIDFDYNDGLNTITATVIQSGLDHGSIGGLGDDDHTQYLLIDGTRAMTGTLDVVGGATSIRGAINEPLLFTTRENSDGSAVGFRFSLDTALTTVGDTFFDIRAVSQSIYRAYLGSGPTIIHEYSDQTILGASTLFDIVGQAPGGVFRIRETSGSEYIEIANNTGVKEIRTNVNGISLICEDGLAGERGVQMFSLTSTHVFAPLIDDDTDLGNSSLGWRRAYFTQYIDMEGIAAPANPSAGERRLFVDSGTGKLSVRTSGGTTVSLEESGGVTDHGALTGLGDDDHTIYALLAGRSTGQTLKGGTGSAENLVLESTNHATKGKVYFGATSNNSYFDEANNLLSINYSGASHGQRLDVHDTITGTSSTALTGHFHTISDPTNNRNASTIVLDYQIETGASAYQKASDLQCFRFQAGYGASDTGYSSYLFGLNLYVGASAWSAGTASGTSAYTTTEQVAVRANVTDSSSSTQNCGLIAAEKSVITLSGAGSASRTITDMWGAYYQIGAFTSTNKTNVTNVGGLKLEFNNLGAFQRATYGNAIAIDISAWPTSANVTYTSAAEQLRLRALGTAGEIAIRQQGTNGHSRFQGNVTIGADSSPDAVAATKLHIKGDPAAITLEESSSTPSSPTSGSQVRMYMKADRIIFQYNDGGTVRYKSMLLTGTGSTWNHSTTPP